MHAETARRSRPVPMLALGQVRYQLLLLARSPLGFLLTLVLPLLVLVSLKLISPGGTGGVSSTLPYGQFLTPAVSAFSLLNAGYVMTVTSVVLAREEGVLKRLHGTPLPAWTYLFGRVGAALLTAAISIAVIVAAGIVFFNVTFVSAAFGYFVAAAVLGLVCFFLVGTAVTVLIPKSETALPVAFGTMLPIAFISDVFFSADTAPAWLRDLASVFPVAPIARAMEDSFLPSAAAWPMPWTGMVSVLGWMLASAAVIAVAFRWEPGPFRLRPRHHPM